MDGDGTLPHWQSGCWRFYKSYHLFTRSSWKWWLNYPLTILHERFYLSFLMFIHIIFFFMNILQHMFFFTNNFMSGFPPWSLVDDRSGRSWSKERKWAWPSPEVVGVDVAGCSVHEVTRVTLLPDCQPCRREWLGIETECGVNCHQQRSLCQKRWPW